MRINGVDVDFTSAQPMPQSFVIAASDEGTDLDTTGNPKVTQRMPYQFTLTEVRASVREPPTGLDSIIVDIHKEGVSILSTRISIDPGDKSSEDAAVQPVILTSVLPDDDEIEIEIDQVGDTTPGKGLKVYLIGNS